MSRALALEGYVVAAAAEKLCFTIVSARLSCCSSRLRDGCYDGRRRSADAELWRPC